MSRVLLFVQTGEGRPKCYAVAAWKHGRFNRHAGASDSYVTAQAFREQRAADRWWLVECENAEHGRRVIEDYDAAARAMQRAVDPNRMGGRILASGGQSDD